MLMLYLGRHVAERLPLGKSSRILVLCFFGSRIASRFLGGSEGRTSACSGGASTICARMTALAAASDRRAPQRCSVDRCPSGIDFSHAAAM